MANSSGNKYHRRIYGLKQSDSNEDNQPYTTVDVYSVLSAYEVTSPGLQHAIKKLLCAGLRGKAGTLQDLIEARDALDRAIEDVEREQVDGNEVH